MLRQINKILKFFKSPLIDLNQIIELVNLNVATLKLQEELKKRTMNDFEDAQEDCDEDQKEEFKGEYENYNDLMQVVMEISGTLLKLYKENIENMIFTNVIPYYYKSLTTESSSENELLYDICIFDDLLEKCTDSLYNKVYLDVLMNFFKLFENNKNIDLLQSLVYGFGVCAQRTAPESFNQFYLPTSKAILSLIDHPQALTPERIVCTECAIGALGKLALFQNNNDLKVRGEILNKFLSLLPLKNEAEEAQNVHRMFLKEIMNKNEVLLKVVEVETLKKVLEGIHCVESNNPELEILDDEGKQLLKQVAI
jgi:hypothetical protein